MPFEKSKSELELEKIKQDDHSGGISFDDVQLGLKYRFGSEKDLFVPEAHDLIYKISLNGLKNQYSRLAFSLPVESKSHQVAVYIDLRSNPIHIQVIDSLANISRDEVMLSLENYISDIKNVDCHIDIKPSPYFNQNDNWSCGVYVFMHLEYMHNQRLSANLDEKYIDDQIGFDLNSKLNLFYYNFITQGRNLYEKDNVYEKNDRNKRNLLDEIMNQLPTEEPEGLNYLNSIKMLSEFLQVELWGNIWQTHKPHINNRSNQANDLLRSRSPTIAAHEYFNLTKEITGKGDSLNAFLIYCSGIGDHYSPILMADVNELKKEKEKPHWDNKLSEILYNAMHKNHKNKMELINAILTGWDESSLINNAVKLLGLSQEEEKLFSGEEGDDKIRFRIFLLDAIHQDFIETLSHDDLPELKEYEFNASGHTNEIKKIKQLFPNAFMLSIHLLASNDNIVKYFNSWLLDSELKLLADTINNKLPPDAQHQFFVNMLMNTNELSQNNINALTQFVPLEYRENFWGSESEKLFRTSKFAEDVYHNLISMDESLRESYMLKIVQRLTDAEEKSSLSRKYFMSYKQLISLIPLSNSTSSEEKISERYNVAIHLFQVEPKVSADSLVDITKLLPEQERMDFIKKYAKNAVKKNNDFVAVFNLANDLVGENRFQELFNTLLQFVEFSPNLLKCLGIIKSAKIQIDFYNNFLRDKLSEYLLRKDEKISILDLIKYFPSDARGEIYRTHADLPWVNQNLNSHIGFLNCIPLDKVEFFSRMLIEKYGFSDFIWEATSYINDLPTQLQNIALENIHQIKSDRDLEAVILILSKDPPSLVEFLLRSDIKVARPVYDLMIDVNLLLRNNIDTGCITNIILNHSRTLFNSSPKNAFDVFNNLPADSIVKIISEGVKSNSIKKVELEDYICLIKEKKDLDIDPKVFKDWRNHYSIFFNLFNPKESKESKLVRLDDNNPAKKSFKN